MVSQVPLFPAEIDALKQLSEMNSNIKFPTITESLFTKLYLPILTYNFTREVSEHIVIKTELWVREVSTSPYYPVNVVSDTDPNKVLYWVPPVYRSGSVFHQTSNRDSFNEVLSTAELKSSVMPRAGDIFMNYELESRLAGNVDLSEDQKQWYRILNNYGIHEYGVTPPISEATSLVSDAITWGEVNEL